MDFVAFCDDGKGGKVSTYTLEDPIRDHDRLVGFDCGPKTIEQNRLAIQSASTIIWSGPMGAFKMPDCEKGTVAMIEEIATRIGQGTATVGISVQGDAAAMCQYFGDKNVDMGHITSATLAMRLLQGKMPGIDALQNKVVLDAQTLASMSCPIVIHLYCYRNPLRLYTLPNYCTPLLLLESTEIIHPAQLLYTSITGIH